MNISINVQFSISVKFVLYNFQCKYEELRKAEKADKEKKLSSAVKVKRSLCLLYS